MAEVLIVGTFPWSHRLQEPGRPTYGAGDNIYRFHDLTQVGTPRQIRGQLTLILFPIRMEWFSSNQHGCSWAIS